MKKLTQDFTLTYRHSPNPGHFVLELQSPGPLPEIHPGQFAGVRIDHSSQVFLRRPLSFHDVIPETNSIRLLVKIAGPGTRALARIEPGHKLNLLYPLGRGFTIPDKGRVLLAGGGCGSAPLLFLARVLAGRGVEVHVALGAKSAEDLPEPASFKAYGEVSCTTEDGSQGEKGLITRGSAFAQPDTYNFIYCCGPLPMMKAVAAIAAAAKTPCEVSLENTMACGIGACLCCVEETKQGNVCVCTEGPVFNTERLLWQI